MSSKKSIKKETTALSSPPATGSKTALIILIVFLVIIVFGGLLCAAGFLVFRPMMGWWWPRTPDFDSTPVATATPTWAPGFGQQDPSVYAQTTLAGYLDSMVKLDIKTALTYCTPS